MMKWLFCMCALFSTTSAFEMEAKVANRRQKRYVAFPEGSTFIVTLCPTISTVTNIGLFFEGVNWGVAYTLPNQSTIADFITDKHKNRRRERRDLYNKIESVIESMGYDGKSCLYRALCEATQKLSRKPKSLSEEFLRIILKFPGELITPDEPINHHLYHLSYSKGKTAKQDCSEIYPGCAISLIDLALGYYEGYDNT